MILLDSSYELDDAPSWERFYLVRGNEPFDVAAVMRAARRVEVDRPLLGLSFGIWSPSGSGEGPGSFGGVFGPGGSFGYAYWFRENLAFTGRLGYNFMSDLSGPAGVNFNGWEAAIELGWVFGKGLSSGESQAGTNPSGR
jgi:hypothetical protein